jgi:hypothetical protein
MVICIMCVFIMDGDIRDRMFMYMYVVLHDCVLRAGLHYGGEGLRSGKNAWPRHGYMRQMVDVPEKN